MNFLSIDVLIELIFNKVLGDNLRVTNEMQTKLDGASFDWMMVSLFSFKVGMWSALKSSTHINVTKHNFVRV